jgi:hypothetical protein
LHLCEAQEQASDFKQQLLDTATARAAGQFFYFELFLCGIDAATYEEHVHI